MRCAEVLSLQPKAYHGVQLKLQLENTPHASRDAYIQGNIVLCVTTPELH